MEGIPRIIYEDGEVLVLDKPSGWVVNRVESTSAPIVQDWVAKLFPNIAIERDGIVHRLDKETSGILLVAKSQDSFLKLTSQFSERRVKKKYLALAHGQMDKSGTIEAEVGRLPWNRERFGVLSGGRASKTGYQVRDYYQLPQKAKGTDIYNGVASFVELLPETGRTHQIRIHLKSIGHPIVSDDFYAGRKTARDDRLWCPRLFLHASYLGFAHPTTGQWVEFESALAGDLVQVLSRLTVLGTV